MTKYYCIEALQRPFLLSQLDQESRSVYSVNFEGYGVESTHTFEDEIAALLELEEIATPMEDLFIGVLPVIANGAGPYIQIINTGGRSDTETHSGEKFSYPRVQILVRAASNPVARDLSHTIYNLLHQRRNVELT